MINKDAHLKEIQESIEELILLQNRTKASNPIAHRYIGTVVHNTIGLLTAPANSLDKGSRNITFSEDENWLSLMKAVHRSYFSSLHTAVEMGFERILKDQKTKAENKQQKKYKRKLETYEPIDENLEAFIIKIIEGIPLNFRDKLDAVLELTSLPQRVKSTWRKFFIGMTVVRNQVSHSNLTLTQQEQKDLIQGGLKALVAKNGDLKVNPKMYKEFAEFSLHFFDLVYSGIK